MSHAHRATGSGEPLPRTGHAVPQTDEASDIRVAAAQTAFKTIFVKDERQTAIMSRINVLRLTSLGGQGKPFDGRRLSQVSQAGKSRTLTVYRDKINATPLPDGGLNPHRVLYFELKGAQTLKMFGKMVLKQLGDPHWDDGNADDVQERVRTFILFRGVELLIIDEVQHLNGDAQNKMDITDELKLFLDAGIVPVVFAGNEKSQIFFEKNEQLCGRLGRPLELSPLVDRAGRQPAIFKTFCRDLDAELLRLKITRRASGLDERKVLSGLRRASGGHIGRVARIVEAAVEHAVARDADFAELYDLHHAVETFAKPQRYVLKNPFTS